MADIKKIKVGNAIYNIRDATAARSNHTHSFDTITNRGEAFLSWGGKNFSGTYGPIDAAMVPELGANRLAFMPADAVTIEYSRDGGATWTDYGPTDSQKIDLFNGRGASFTIGKATSGAGNIATNKYQLRVNIYTSAGSVYTALNKFVIYLSTSGTNGNWCTIRARKQSDYTAGNDKWTTFADKISVSGWSGYNVINTSGITTYGNTASTQYGHIQFIFGCDTGSTNNSYAGLSINKIFGFGGVGWTTPSTMAKTGHMYTYDSSQNVIFPEGVSAKSFTENGTSLTNKYLGKTAKAADADKLDGNDSTYYLDYNNLNYKPTLGTAASKNTGTSSGNIPILDSNGKLADSVIPAVAITDTYVVATEAAMLALSAQKGDIAIRSDLNKSFVLQSTPASTLANWKELLTPTDAVLSVNSKKGAVTLNLDDINDGSTRKLSGYVTGPSSSTANAVPRYDGTTGKIIKDSGVTISDANVLSAAQLAANIIETGTGDNNYFQSRKFRGEGNAATYYHAVDFGFAGHNQVDFYEYGGLWNFWKNTDATATTASSNLCLQIGDTYIKNKGNTFTWPATSGTLALKDDIPKALKNPNALKFGSKTYDGSSAQTITLADLGGQAAGNYALKSEIIAKSVLTAKGDLIYASAANTPARLGIGSAGQFLSIANGIPTWVNNPNTNTWRKVQLNGTDKLGTGINTNPLNIKAGSNMTITESNGTFTFAATAIKTLKTDNTAAQATSASEAIAGSGTINLHKVAKTGSYNDLNNKPTIPDISGLVPYDGATHDVTLVNHTLVISDKTSADGADAGIKVSGKGIIEDDVWTTIKPNGIRIESPSIRYVKLSPSELIISDDTYSGSVTEKGFEAGFNGESEYKSSIYEYDGITHNGKKLLLPAKAGTLATLDDTKIEIVDLTL